MRPRRDRRARHRLHRQQRADRRRRRDQGGAVHPTLLPGRTCRSSTCRTRPATWSAARPSSAGMIKHGSKMIQAVANATVPQLTIHVGASFGAGNYGMCGRAYDPRFIFAWPSNRIAVMGGEQAAKVMEIVTEEKLKREGKPVDKARIEVMEKASSRAWRAESTALYTTARLLDDGLIDPRDTRRVLGFCLSICREADIRPLKPNISASRACNEEQRRWTSRHEHDELAADAAALHRRGDQPARRRVGGGRDLPRARGVQEAGRPRPARPHQAGGLRRAGARLLLSPW